MARPHNFEAKQRILCAAYGLFHQKGFRGVSMDDVAGAAKVKKANLFHYFPSKEDLGLAVFDYASSCQKERILNTYSPENSEDPVRFVSQIFAASQENMKKNSCCRGCFMGNFAQEMSDHNEKIRKKIEQYFDFWLEQMADVLERGKDKGFFRKELKPRESAGAILALLEGALMFSKTRKNVTALQSAGRMASEYLENYRTARR